MENIDWKSLPFGYIKTDFNVRSTFKNSNWSELEISTSEMVNVHIAATGLHYGQQAFEGMKAFMGKDGKVRLFRWIENFKRMQNSADGILMQRVPENIFHNAIVTAVKKNAGFIPPYGSGASLYIRPVLFGSGAKVGVSPSDEYTFIVFVTPVGPYFKNGFTPVDMMIAREFDRAAPKGTGNIKVGGNYASGLRAMRKAHDEGFASVLFLDAREKKFIDECGPANFFGIKDNTYITPKSESILPSITNMSLIELAISEGLKAERRPIADTELSTFEEVGACGTAAVISPIKKIVDEESGKVYEYCKDGKPGPISYKLFSKLQAIQYGEIPDKYNWTEIVEL